MSDDASFTWGSDLEMPPMSLMEWCDAVEAACAELGATVTVIPDPDMPHISIDGVGVELFERAAQLAVDVAEGSRVGRSPSAFDESRATLP